MNPADSSPRPLLEITGLSKTFPGQRALTDVDLAIRAGEVHALVGQNGSGKSTLIKILAGYHQPDTGATILLNGEPHGTSGGLAFVHQDLALVPTINGVENMALGRRYARTPTGAINWRAEHQRARQAIAEFGAEFDLLMPVARLTGVQRTILAMARAAASLGTRPSVLVLDEPTASLPQREVELLKRAIRRRAASGMGVLYVSHRLEEVFDLCDRVTVLRDGHKITTDDVAKLDHDSLVRLIIGRDLDALYSVPPEPGSDVVLRAADLAGGNVSGLSLDVLSGEIVGVSGLLGSGREDVSGLLFGSKSPVGGTITVRGASVPLGSPRASMEHGIGMVPANRAQQAMFALASVNYNLTLPLLRPLLRRGALNRRKEEVETEEWMQRVDLRPRQASRPLGLYSGGNQQKVILARWLRTKPSVLVLDEPTQGVDVGAKAAIYEMLTKAARQGLAIVVVSSDAEELVELCDRVIIMRNGRQAATLSGQHLTEARVVHECLSVAA